MPKSAHGFDVFVRVSTDDHLRKVFPNQDNGQWVTPTVAALFWVCAMIYVLMKGP